MSRRVPNQARNADVHLPEYAQANTLPVRSAADLTAEQLWVLLELSLRHGGHPADRCYSQHLFEPTEADRAIIDRRIEAHRGEWAPWIALYAPPVCAPGPAAPAPETAAAPDEFTGELPPTETYSRRAWTWEPAGPDADGRLGTLTIELERDRGGREYDEYAVAELDPLPGLMGRVFRLVNMSETPPLPGFGERTAYEVVVGGLARCGCPAGQFRAQHGEKACKHLAVLALLVGSGVIGSTPAPALAAAHTT